MKKVSLLVLCLLLAISLTGCIKTYTYQVERKDQDLVGNRGVVKGEIPPPVTGRKRMRTMGGVDVELPPPEEYKAKKEALEEEAAPKEVRELEAKEKVVEKEAPVKEEAVAKEVAGEKVAKLEIPEEKPRGFADEQWVKKEKVEEKIKEIKYTVKEGDTLGKVAFKFLGDSSKWPEIYEANKDIIKDPARIYPGQVIVIPQVEPEEEVEEAYK